jgi:uncharacterized membrane protein YkvA (DUF1232 family)
MQRLRAWAGRLKRDGLTLWFACADPATPWPAKVLGALVVAYALSPIDLVPDFIPVLGYLDELLLLPALIWLALRWLPAPVLAAARRQAERWLADRRARPRSWAGAVAVVLLWLAALGLLAAWGWGPWPGP